MNYPLAIVQVKSRKSGRKYFVGIPSADVDYVTDGLLVLTSKEKIELVLCMATKEEYPLGPVEACRRCAIRSQAKLGRDDLAPVLSNFDEPARKLASLGSLFLSWNYAFVDIYYQDDFADPVSELTCEGFLSSGGLITDLRDLT
ncbi:MAG: hypothetical protein K0Q55_3033 [Verrucomicrobia bacterium]|jgi:hypothetical protein|nr:hypothetical protein [Verrucomicrobiota bacterium]